MRKAKVDIQALNAQTNKVTGAMGQFAQNIAGMDFKAAKATKAVVGLVSSLSSLNPIMLGVTAATAAFTWGVEQCNKKQQEAEERAKALRKELVKLWDVGFDPQYIKKTQDELKSITEDFDRVTKQANALAAALTKMQNAKGMNKIIELEVEKANAGFTALDDAQRQLSDAYYDAKIAEEKLNQTRAQQKEAMDNAYAIMRQSEERLQMSRDSIGKLNEEREKLVAQLEWIYGNEEAEKDLKKRIADVDNAIAKAKEEEQARLTELKIAVTNETTARESAKAAIAKAEIALTASLKHHEDVQDALDKRKKAEEEAAEAARQNADADRRAAEYKAVQESLTNDLNEMLKTDISTEEGLNSAKEKMTELLEKYADNMGDGEVFSKMEKAFEQIQKKLMFIHFLNIRELTRIHVIIRDQQFRLAKQ